MTRRGLSIILYGTEGVGKTSLALQFKKELLCLSINENGFDNLDMVGDVPEDCENENIDSFAALLNRIRKAEDYSTLIIDSISGIEQLTRRHVMKEHYADKEDPEKAYASFSEGDKKLVPLYMEKICNELTLLNTKGINTILIGHERRETIKNPTGSDYTASVIDMESWGRSVLTKWAGAVLFMTLDMEVMVTKTFKGKPTEAKSTNDILELSDRIVYTTRHPSHSAKNVYKLPPYISLGESPQEAYKRLMSSFPEKIRQAQ